MPDEIITKRMNYFDRQFLRASDFIAQRDYDTDRNRRLGRMFTPGVIEGLEISGNVGGATVDVRPGTALDPLGRQIVMAIPRVLNLRGEAGEYDIYCIYDERETDSRLEGGVEGNTRIEESPEFTQLLTSQNAEAPENGVRLARLRLNEAGSLVAAPDNSIRNLAGAVLPDALDLRTLRLERDGVDQRDWPVLSCSRRNEAGLDGNLLVEGNLSVNGSITGDIRAGAIGTDQLANGAVSLSKLRTRIEGVGEGAVTVLPSATQELEIVNSATDFLFMIPSLMPSLIPNNTGTFEWTLVSTRPNLVPIFNYILRIRNTGTRSIQVEWRVLILES
jgi:hypothetical protein